MSRKKINILNIEPRNYSPHAKKILTALGRISEQELSRKQLLAQLPRYDVLITRLKLQIDREIINAGKNLKTIVSATTGLDHIDVEYAEKKGIQIISLTGEKNFLKTVPATADYTWGLVLALTRRIPEAFESVKKGKWERDQLRGHDVLGKRLGIVGLGRIGKKVAAYGKAFGMKIYFWDPCHVKHSLYIKRKKTIEELMKNSDVLCIHAPLTKVSRMLIGQKLLKLLPREAYVINTARGEILDVFDLLKLLKQKKIAGAALDVVPEERNPHNKRRKALMSYLRKHRNLILTPHIGGATVESMEKTEVFMAKKLVSYFQEK